MSMRAQSIANILLKDALAERPEVHVDLNRCLVCSRTFTAGKGVGTNGRFCSRLCVDAFDAGYVHRSDGVGSKDWAVVAPAFDKGGAVKNLVGTRPYARNLPKSGDGFLVGCRHCKRQFVSKGLRCCSVECECQLDERRKIEATMAEVEMESTGYVPRQCEHCGATLPRYVGTGKNRKQSFKRFCSPKCKQAAWKAAKIAAASTYIADPPERRPDPLEVPAAQQVANPSSVPLDLLGGGSFQFRGAGLDRELRKAILDAEVPAPTVARIEAPDLAPTLEDQAEVSA
jgi:hypothetical protein